MNGELTALDAYTNRVYKIIMLVIPISCLCASITITLLHYLGYYPDINEFLMWLFDIVDISFLVTGLYFIKTGFDKNGFVIRQKLIYGKYTAAIIAIIQWNAISYIWPFRDLWAFCLLFTLGEAFFFDTKLVSFTSLGLVVSMVISWFVKGDLLLPVRDEFFVANMTFRIVCIILTMLCINIVTFFGGKFLVEELEKYVYRDPLTHLLTRRRMDSYINEAYKKATAGTSTFSLMMLDIDDFKRVNDTYGHDCGDNVLKFVANTISSGVKNDDVVFRWGGEEILVLVNEDEKTAAETAEKIRADIENGRIHHKDDINVSVTVTIGVCAYRDGLTAEQMMDIADKNLYYGKHNGKNRVVCKTE
ncbi:MAG: GGDEF domain-containing protein [Firmicutes bacterium]|nr:GGDEF domain-containing protein [Bacillota bacterium]